MSVSRDELLEDFVNPDGRLDEEALFAYADSFLNTLVAAQIKTLREQRGFSQEDLARLIGTKQSGISRLENVNYSAWKTETLRKIAKGLRVRLKISFETFGTLLDDIERFNRASLRRVDPQNDLALRTTEAPTLTTITETGHSNQRAKLFEFPAPVGARLSHALTGVAPPKSVVATGTGR